MPRSQPQTRHSVPVRTVAAPDAPSAPLHRHPLTRWIGSLQVAVILLPLFAFVLFLGTLVESWHDRRTAHQLVYGTWWFAGLLGLLGANVVCAALKKWPWKRHQTGFLITHLGLITLVFSGLLTALGGTSGVLVMVDSQEEQFRGFGMHSTDFAIDRDRQTIRVLRNGAEVVNKEFMPAPFRWGAKPQRLELLTRVLEFLAHPWPHGWCVSLGEMTRLEVLTYYQHTKEWPFLSDSITPGSFPAIEFQLASPTTGPLAPQWLAHTERGTALRIGAGQVEFLARDLTRDELVAFQNPETASVETTSQRIARLRATPRHADAGVRGVLQFVTSADGQPYFRSYVSSGEQFVFESAATITPGDGWQRIWAGMEFKLQITEFMSHAHPGPYFEALNHRPVREEDATPAVRCRLTNRADVRDFWLGKTDGGLTNVSVGGDHYLVGYNSTLRKLGFELTLLRAEQTTDPGSNMPASQSSRVHLRDPSRGIDREQIITLNEPLEHAGYTIYQTGYAQVGTDSRGQPVGRSLLTVTSDPGLYLKYFGSAMVALGIACMFYMRAYFFKRTAEPGA